MVEVKYSVEVWKIKWKKSLRKQNKETWNGKQRQNKKMRRLIQEAKYLTNRCSRDRTKTMVEKKDYTKGFPELKSSLQIIRFHIMYTGSSWTDTGCVHGRKTGAVLPRVHSAQCTACTAGSGSPMNAQRPTPRPFKQTFQTVSDKKNSLKLSQGKNKSYPEPQEQEWYQPSQQKHQDQKTMEGCFANSRGKLFLSYSCTISVINILDCQQPNLYCQFKQINLLTSHCVGCS